MSKFIGNINDYIAWEEKRQKRVAKKQKLIQEALSTLKNDICTYEKFIFDLVEESLQKRTNKELLEIIN